MLIPHLKYQAFILILLIGFVVHHPSHAQPKELTTVLQTGNTARITSVALSGDGKRIITGSWDNTAILWEAKTGKQIYACEGHEEWLTSVAINDDGQFVLTGSEDNTAKLWNTNTGEVLHTLKGHRSFITTVALNGDGTLALTGSLDRKAKLWNTQTGKTIRTFKGHTGGVTSVSLSNNGNIIATGSEDRTAKVWDAQTGKLLHDLKGGHKRLITAVAISNDGKLLLSGAWDNKAILWDTEEQIPILELKKHKGAISSVAISQDQKYLLTGSWDRTAHLWNAESGDIIHTFRGHEEGITSVAFSNDGKTILTGSEDNTTKLWESKSGKQIYSLEGLDTKVTSIALSADDRWLLTGSTDNTAKLWDIEAGKLKSSLEGHEGEITAVAIGEHSQFIATASRDYQTKIWDLNTGVLQYNLEGHTGAVNSVAINSKNYSVITGSNDQTAKIWDLASGELKHTLDEHKLPIQSVAISPNGKWVATGSGDKTLKWWDVETGELIHTFEGHLNGISTCKFSPDNTTLFSGSADRQIKAWSLTDTTLLKTYTGHTGQITAIAFNNDGSQMISSSAEKELFYWNTEEGKIIHELNGHKGNVNGVAISFHKNYLLSGSEDGTIRIWDTEKGHELATLVAIKHKDWAVTTPKGYFEASEGGKKFVYFMRGLEVFELDQFFMSYYRPRLLREIWRGLDPKKLGAPAFFKLRTAPPPEISILRPESGEVADNGKAKIVVEAKDMGGGISYIHVKHNGKQVQETSRKYRQRPTKGNVIVDSFYVDLLEGENIITATAQSRDLIESKEEKILLSYEGEQQQTVCYILSIGISLYNNTAQKIEHAHSDAKALEKAFQKKNVLDFDKVESVTLINGDANKENIQKVLKDIAKKANPQDVFVLYYAGFGGIYGRDFCFLAADSYQPDKSKIKASAITDKDLRKQLIKIPARQQLILVDLYQPEKLWETDFLKKVNEEKALAQLAHIAGVHVLSASRKTYNKTLFKKGVFVKTFLEALEGGADTTPKDGSVTIREIERYLEQNLPQLASKNYGEAEYPANFLKGQNFSLQEVKYKNKEVSEEESFQGMIEKEKGL